MDPFEKLSITKLQYPRALIEPRTSNVCVGFAVPTPNLPFELAKN
jgi:hypothetical protein